MDKVHLLQETILSRLGEVAIVSIAQKPTQCVKENGEMEKNDPNKRTR